MCRWSAERDALRRRWFGWRSPPAGLAVGRAAASRCVLVEAWVVGFGVRCGVVWGRARCATAGGWLAAAAASCAGGKAAANPWSRPRRSGFRETLQHRLVHARRHAVLLNPLPRRAQLRLRERERSGRVSLPHVACCRPTSAKLVLIDPPRGVAVPLFFPRGPVTSRCPPGTHPAAGSAISAATLRGICMCFLRIACFCLQ